MGLLPFAKEKPRRVDPVSEAFAGSNIVAGRRNSLFFPYFYNIRVALISCQLC